MVDIRDVPCGDCQRGYGRPHSCDVPDYCACDQGSLHVQHQALGATPGYCRALNPERTFMCDQPAGHEGEHVGFELPTITLDETP
jgi:hypothetical protein